MLFDDKVFRKKKWKFQLKSKKTPFVGYFCGFGKIQTGIYGYEGDEPYIHHYSTKKQLSMLLLPT